MALVSPHIPSTPLIPTQAMGSSAAHVAPSRGLPLLRRAGSAHDEVPESACRGAALSQGRTGAGGFIRRLCLPQLDTPHRGPQGLGSNFPRWEPSART